MNEITKMHYRINVLTVRCRIENWGYHKSMFKNVSQCTFLAEVQLIELKSTYVNDLIFVLNISAYIKMFYKLYYLHLRRNEFILY